MDANADANPDATPHGALHAARLRLAQASIGAVHLAIPVDAVVRAVPLPDAPSLLPRRQGALRCVIEHRGTLVPVVDLARWVETGTPAGNAQEARILVLHRDGRTIGLQVDAVGGLIDVAPHLLTRLHHDDSPDEVFHTVLHSPEDDRILNLLDVGRLADLALAWSEAGQGAAQASAPAAAGTGPAADLKTWALLETGHGRLAVPPAHLAEVMPMPALERFGGGIDSAYCIWRGRHLPVLPAAALMDGGAEARGAEARGAEAGGTASGHDRLLAVIDDGGLALGIPVRAALQLCALEGRGLPAPDGITATLYDADGIEIRLLDTARLFARFPEAALGKPSVTGAGAAETAQRRKRNGAGYIVFEADGLRASPLGAIEHILPLAGATAATMDWRGAAIPMVDLRSAAPAASANVLVVRAADGHVGYVVSRVHSMIPPGTGTLYRMGGIGGGGLEFITTGEGAEQASYRTFDLVARAAA